MLQNIAPQRDGFLSSPRSKPYSYEIDHSHIGQTLARKIFIKRSSNFGQTQPQSPMTPNTKVYKSDIYKTMEKMVITLSLYRQ